MSTSLRAIGGSATHKWFRAALYLVFLLAAVLSLFNGSYPLDCFDVLSAILGVNGQPQDTAAVYLLWSVRLPRMIMAILVGGGLALAGGALQGLFRNPLADPALLGISSGAMAMVALGMAGGGAALWTRTQLGGQALMIVLGFAGSLLAASWVYRLATRQGQTSIGAMLLAGMAVTALSGAVTGLVIYFADDAALRDITFWTLGSLGGAQWSTVSLLAPFVLLASWGLMQYGRTLDLMSLGEQNAASTGVAVQRAKGRITALATLLVGACVATTGIISFVALVAPHLVRLIAGASHRQLLPMAGLMGACLLLIADTLARVLVPPAELPIGILTALLGAPFFLWLLRRSFHLV